MFVPCLVERSYLISTQNVFLIIGTLTYIVTAYIDSTDRDLIWSTVSAWLYQSRAGAKRRPETDTARLILWTISNRGLYWIYFTLILLKFAMVQ